MPFIVIGSTPFVYEHGVYVDYCRDNGRQPLGKARFIPEMKRKGYTAVKNQGIYKYRDLKFKETPFEPIPDYVEPPFR